MQRARSAACEELSARGARVADEEQLGVDVDGGRGVEAGDAQRAQPDLGAASGDQGIDALRGLPGRRFRVMVVPRASLLWKPRP
jgi:hypothetical protein